MGFGEAFVVGQESEMEAIDWNKCVASVLKRSDDIGREEYLGMIDDVVAGMDADAIATKHRAKISAVSSAIALVSSCVHGPHPVPTMDAGGWYAAAPEPGGYVVAPGFSAAWKAARVKN